VPIDEIVRAADAPPAMVIAALVELSLAGRASLPSGGLAASV
jgi:DNA processing protein